MPTPFSACLFRFRSPRRGGFTLVEIMAAIAITVLLMLFFSIFLNTATVLISTSEKHLNADAQARLVFDRMQLDIAGMVKRKDIGALFNKVSGNDSFYFYSAAPGYYADNVGTTNETDLTLVGYAIGGSGSAYGVNQLQRYGAGQECAWAGSGISPLFASPGTTNITTSSLTDTNYHVLAPAVFRLEIAFLVRENNQNFEITDTPPALGNYRNEGDEGYPNLWAILVDIAALDTTSGATLTSAQYATLNAALADFTGATTLPVNQAPSSPVSTTSMDPILSAWSSAIESSTSTFYAAGVPANVARQVRVYERAFYLQ